LGCLSLRRR
jgi:hypothetical protein